MSYELIIFDCDGVLVDSEPLAIEALLEMVAESGRDMSPADAAEQFLGLSWRATREKLANEFGVVVDDARAERMRMRLFEMFRERLRATPGVASALYAVASKRCVASSSSPERLDLSLGLVGLLDAFAPNIFSATMVRRGKPAPDLFLFAAERMGVDPSACLVIEDSPAGVQAAQAARMDVFAYVGGAHAAMFDLRSRLAALGPQRIFDDMAELPALLGAASEQRA